MKLAIMQPYFFPYIGYFKLINSVEKFVIFDDVNFIKRGWIHRNRILCNGQVSWFTLELQKASRNKLINQIKRGDNCDRLLKTLQYAYGKAPYFKEVYPVLEHVLSNSEENIARYLGEAIIQISKFLDIKRKFAYSSDIPQNLDFKGQFKIIDICKNLKAKQYINSIGGKELYDTNSFQKEQIQLSFLQSIDDIYNQFDSECKPNLSIIDVMMFNSKEQIHEMLSNYILS